MLQSKHWKAADIWNESDGWGWGGVLGRVGGGTAVGRRARGAAFQASLPAIPRFALPFQDSARRLADHHLHFQLRCIVLGVGASVGSQPELRHVEHDRGATEESVRRMPLSNAAIPVVQRQVRKGPKEAPRPLRDALRLVFSISPIDW